MKVRAARQSDLLSVKRLSVDASAEVVEPSLFDDVHAALLPLLVPGREKVWVAADERGAVGFVQARPRKYLLGWSVTRLRAASGSEHQEEAVLALIQAVLHHLHARGIPRLFVRTPAESPAHDMMVRTGFTHLLSECIFVRRPDGAPAPDQTPIGMRYRMPQDAWPLRQLENAQTPLLVAQLEGLTSLGWSMSRRRLLRHDEPSELVVEREDGMIGWAGWSPTKMSKQLGECVRLGLLCQLDDMATADALVDYALHAIGSARPDARVVVRLRDYQMPLHQVLLDHGFEEAGRETLHIKHGRLQFMPKKASRLLELAPTLRPPTLEPSPR